MVNEIDGVSAPWVESRWYEQEREGKKIAVYAGAYVAPGEEWPDPPPQST
jgi:hypothetical protein